MTITYATRPYSKDEVLEALHPFVAEWFASFPEITPPQQHAVVAIKNGKSTLIASPTGSGKTLSAFISIISELVRLEVENRLEDKVYCIYISPLRSLNNDIHKNLLRPVQDINAIALAKNFDLSKIRIGVRTGDTPQSERAKMLKKPPHILITTPESLAILLCAPKFREHLRTVRWIIVDEIHEICSSKRGVHLSLSLERLQELCAQKFARIGLSATIHPLEEVAKFLVGQENEVDRDCLIVDTRFVKPTELLVTCPVPDLIHTPAPRITSKMYSQIKDLVRKHQTTLVFTNTRSGTERVVYHLKKLNAVDADELAAHHSSLSREIRKDVEDRLKEGKMKAVVTSTSLELGIDIGSIDLVGLVGSPKSISRCLQRVGRSGHTLEKVSKGVMVAMDRDDLVEDAVIASEASRGNLDKVYIPKGALDVLAQHLIGMAVERKWSVREAYGVVIRSYCYNDLKMEVFKRVLKYLSGGYQGLEEFRVYGKIWYDEAEEVFGRRGALLRMLYSTNIGTIPDEVAVRVYTTEGRWIGLIEEEFLERLTKGDIFILGGRTFEFRYAKGFKAYVKLALKGKPTVPSWFSEMLPLSFDLGEAIGRFRSKVFEELRNETDLTSLTHRVARETFADRNATAAIVNYLKEEHDFLRSIGVRELPTNTNIVIEDYVDPENRQNFIFNCVFGRRINDALSRAYACAPVLEKGKNVMVTVSDSGFMLTFPSGLRLEPRWLIGQVTSANLRMTILEALRRTELVKRRFRHSAARSLMILRNYKGHQITVPRQQMNAHILLGICEELDGFPVLEEAYREVVEDLMDVQTAERILLDIERGDRRFIICHRSDVPSPFTHNLIVAGYSDVVLMADRRALLEELYESVTRRIQERKLVA